MVQKLIIVDYVVRNLIGKIRIGGVTMKLIITVDIDVAESGLDEEFMKDNIIDFTRNLLVNGAA